MTLHEVPIPGGHAWLREPVHQTVAQKRPLQLVMSQLGSRRFAQIVAAQTVQITPAQLDAMSEAERTDVLAEQMANVEALGLSRDEWSLMYEMTDATIVGLLDHWDLVGEDGQPMPCPTTVEQVGAMPDEVHTSLSLATARLQGDHVKAHGFDEAEAMENPASPTGASEPSDSEAHNEADPDGMSSVSTATEPWWEASATAST
jgi:hypothetical protein